MALGAMNTISAERPLLFGRSLPQPTFNGWGTILSVYAGSRLYPDFMHERDVDIPPGDFAFPPLLVTDLVSICGRSSRRGSLLVCQAICPPTAVNIC